PDFQQPLPIDAVPREPRGLARPRRADLAERHLRDQALEAGPLDTAGRRLAEILVDDLDVAPAETAQPVGHRVLEPPALFVVQQLLRGRLPDVEHRAAREMPGGDLLTHRRPPRRPRPRRAAAVRAARPGRGAPPPGGLATAARAASPRSRPVAARPCAPARSGCPCGAMFPVRAASSTGRVSASSWASAANPL